MPTLKEPVTAKDHIQGTSSAPITLVEFGDYQCPFCRNAHFVVKKLQKHFGKQMRFVFRNFPLAEIHPFAEAAAEAAEFANSQSRFWEMHDLIYENQDALSIPMLEELGQLLGLSTDKLLSAIENQTYGERIQNDFSVGVRSGVNGTPTFFINGQRYNGAFEFQDFVDATATYL